MSLRTPSPILREFRVEFTEPFVVRRVDHDTKTYGDVIPQYDPTSACQDAVIVIGGKNLKAPHDTYPGTGGFGIRLGEAPFNGEPLNCALSDLYAYSTKAGAALSGICLE